jgi:hypothetical protein
LGDVETAMGIGHEFGPSINLNIQCLFTLSHQLIDPFLWICFESDRINAVVKVRRKSD